MLFCFWQPMPPVRSFSFGNATDCAECRAQSLKWMCLGLNLERLIFQLEWGVSQKPQVGSRCTITLMSWWWVWKAVLPAWLQWEHQHSELNCLSHSRMHQEILIPVQEYLIGDEVWNFYLLKKQTPTNPTKSNISPFPLSQFPVWSAFYFAVAQDPTPCMLWWKMSLILREDNYCFQCCLEHLISCSIQMKQTAFTK